MNRLEKILSRPTAKPYRSGTVNPDEQLYFNDKDELDFAPDDIENPKNWSTGRRWYITVVCLALCINSTFASSSPSGCLESISEEFHVSVEASGLVITLFLLGYCAGPLFFAPLSEFYGRRYVFYVSFTCYFAFNFLCAFTPSFAGLLVGRFLTGTCASSALTNAPGILADVWGPIERANAMALFSMMTFIGPAVGPVISGFLQLKENWRWSFYVLIWLSGASLLFLVTIPETYPPVVLYNKARRLRATGLSHLQEVKAPVEATGRNLSSIFKVALLRPWLILFDPISTLVAIYLSVVYTLLYMLFSIVPIIFQEKRGWNSGVGELPLLGTVIGACIGGAAVFYQSSLDKKKMLKGIPRKPEDRLPLAMIGGCVFAVTMFWFAWTGEFNSIHWIVPTLALTLLSSSILLIFVSYLNYLTDTYLMFTASAMAANTICRSACGAAAPLFTRQMFAALGVGGGGSLVGGMATLLAPIPFIFYKYGQRIRQRSRFAPTPPPAQAQTEEKNDMEAQAPQTDAASVSSQSSSSTLTTESIENGSRKSSESKRELPGASDNRDREKSEV